MALARHFREFFAEDGADTIEVRSIDYIPESERHGRAWKQGPFWFTVTFQPFAIALGLIGPGLGLSLTWTVLAGASGAVFGTLLVALHAVQGPRLGLAQMIQSRAQFGYRGALVALAAAMVTLVGFNVVGVIFISDGLHGLFGWNGSVVALVTTVLAAVLIIYGHDWLHWIFRLLFAISMPFWLALSIAAFSGHVGGAASPAGVSLVAFMIQATVCASYAITLAPYVSDYTRYLPSDISSARTVGWMFAGVTAATIWGTALGAWLATRWSATDPITGVHDAGNAMLSGLGGTLALLAVILLVAGLGFSGYSAMLTTITAITTIRPVALTRALRIGVTSVLAVVWVVIALPMVGAGLTTSLNNALLIMLYLVAPWSAVNLVDFYIVRHGHYAIADLFTPTGIYGAWNWRGVVSYAVGLASEIPFVALSFFSGPATVALGGVDIAFLVGLLAAGAAYLAFVRSPDQLTENAAMARAAANFSQSNTRK